MNRLRIAFPYVMLLGVVAVVAASNVSTDRPAESASVPATATCGPCGMDLDPASALSARFAGRTRYFCGERCLEAALAGAPKEQPNASDRLVDVVCRMEVNAAWDIRAEHGGTTYHFCNDRCRQRFEADPETYLARKCIVCNAALGDGPAFTATYLGKPYETCGEAHRAEFKADPAAFFMHTMWGIPPWLYYVSIAFVLVVSFGVFDRLSRQAPAAASSSVPARKAAGVAPTIPLPIVSPFIDAGAMRAATAIPTRSGRFDLLTNRWIRACLRSRVFRFACQLLVSAVFLLIIAAGLFGNQNPALNIAPILTWTVWWGLLIVLILFAGKAWCYVCPWDAIAGWTERLAFWRKSDDGLTLGWKWPRVVRNISIATILFVGLTWIELGFGVTMKPRVTAWLAIAMLLMAVVSALLFERKGFCRYACLVGRVSGLYALFAGTEVRPRSRGLCASCRTKECVKGGPTAYGCPTFLYPGGLRENTYCIQCMECLQACPHDNLAVNLRPWGSDLAAAGRPRTDEAYLALLMLAITGFHGLTMTPVWGEIIASIRGTLDAGRIAGFSIGMAMLMIGPVAIYAALVAVSMWMGRGRAPQPRTYRDYFIRYAYALLPIALFYHLAHNAEHLLMEGPKVAAMISDPFGWGWNLLGTAHWTIPPLVSLGTLWIIQVLLVLVGHVYSLWVAQRTSLRLFGSAEAALRSQLPMLVGMIAFSVFSLWLLKQPMEMRTSAM